MFPKTSKQPAGGFFGKSKTPKKPKTPLLEDMYLFDLNAVAPGAFGQIDNDFADYVQSFARFRSCYLISSLSYNEVMLRLPERLRQAFKGIYVSSGAEYWSGDEVVERQDHEFSDDLYEFLAKAVQSSNYPDKKPPLIEQGPSTLRVCLAGTQSTIGELKAYLQWETEHREIPVLIRELKARFPDHNVYQDTGESFVIMPDSFSSAQVHESITSRHKNVRLIGCFSPGSVESFADPLCKMLSSAGLLTVVGGPSDLSHLLSYEFRRNSEHARLSLPARRHASGVH